MTPTTQYVIYLWMGFFISFKKETHCSDKGTNMTKIHHIEKSFREGNISTDVCQSAHGENLWSHIPLCVCVWGGLYTEG